MEYQKLLRPLKLFKLITGWFKYLLVQLLIGLIIGLRPLLGPATCRFHISCTQFAITKLKEETLLKALWHIIKRLACCHPLYPSK